MEVGTIMIGESQCRQRGIGTCIPNRPRYAKVRNRRSFDTLDVCYDNVLPTNAVFPIDRWSPRHRRQNSPVFPGFLPIDEVDDHRCKGRCTDHLIFANNRNKTVILLIENQGISQLRIYHGRILSPASGGSRVSTRHDSSDRGYWYYL